MTNATTEATTATGVELDKATQRQLGVDLYNSTWTLIEKADRTAAETDEMIGPRTPMLKPKTGTNSASSMADGAIVIPRSSAMPVAVPQKLTVTVCR